MAQQRIYRILGPNARHTYDRLPAGHLIEISKAMVRYDRDIARAAGLYIITREHDRDLHGVVNTENSYSVKVRYEDEEQRAISDISIFQGVGDNKLWLMPAALLAWYWANTEIIDEVGEALLKFAREGEDDEVPNSPK